MGPVKHSFEPPDECLKWKRVYQEARAGHMNPLQRTPLGQPDNVINLHGARGEMAYALGES